jgi:hypothetical protein
MVVLALIVAVVMDGGWPCGDGGGRMCRLFGDAVAVLLRL